jgi:hypothetical protein
MPNIITNNQAGIISKPEINKTGRSNCYAQSSLYKTILF